MKKSEQRTYLTPEIEVNEISIEQGFSISIEHTEREEEFEW